jgi:hypothetical protein
MISICTYYEWRERGRELKKAYVVAAPTSKMTMTSASPLGKEFSGTLFALSAEDQFGTYYIPMYGVQSRLSDINGRRSWTRGTRVFIILKVTIRIRKYIHLVRCTAVGSHFKFKYACS